MLSECLSDAWRLFLRHLGPLSTISLALLVPTQGLVIAYPALVSPEGFSPAVAYLLSAAYLLALVVQTAAVIYYVAAAVEGNVLPPRVAWSRALTAFLPFLGLTIIVVFATLLGVFLFVVPGVYVYFLLAFASFELLLHDEGIGSSISLSMERTRGYKVALFFGTVAIFLVPLLLDFFVQISTLEAGPQPGSVEITPRNDFNPYWIFSALMWIYAGILLQIFYFRVYWYAGEQRASGSVDQDTSTPGGASS